MVKDPEVGIILDYPVGPRAVTWSSGAESPFLAVVREGGDCTSALPGCAADLEGGGRGKRRRATSRSTKRPGMGSALELPHSNAAGVASQL